LQKVRVEIASLNANEDFSTYPHRAIVLSCAAGCHGGPPLMSLIA
jgi:hypothetical protein